MKQIRIIACVVSLIIALTAPSLAQLGGQNAETGGEVYQIEDPLKAAYFAIGKALLENNNEMLEEYMRQLKGLPEQLSTEILTSSYEGNPPLLVLSMLKVNAEAFDLIYKSIPSGQEIFALEDAFKRFPKEEGKESNNRFTSLIQETNVSEFMYYYNQAVANGTLIEDLNNAFMELETIIEP